MSRTKLGKYVDLKQIGQGGMAEVYIGTDPTLNRKVAIKLILPHFADKTAFENRFQREAKTVAGLRHSAIVQIYEYSIENGTPFMVMEYLHGGTLDDLLAKNKSQGITITLEKTAQILQKVAGGLDYAHQRGLIHRDIKPSNILISDEGEPIIADFGIVKLLDEASVLTQTGGVVGSPRYLPPEQASQKDIDHRSDIYSLGIVVYQMLTGEVPFDGDLISVMMQHVNNPPKNPRSINPDIPEAAVQVILKALEKDPHDRYDNAGQFAAAFRKSIASPAFESSNSATATDLVATTLLTVPKEHLTSSPPVASPPVASIPVAQKRTSRAFNSKLILAVAGLLLFTIFSYFLFRVVFNKSEADSPDPANTLTAINALVQATDLPSSDDILSEDAQPTVTSIVQTLTESTPLPTEISPLTALDTTPHGAATLRQSTITIIPQGLNSLDEGLIYAAWLTEPNAAPLYLGTLGSDLDPLIFTDPQDRDLLLSYSAFSITITQIPDSEPVFSGTNIYQAQLDEQLIADYRHLKNTSPASLDAAMRSNMVVQAQSFKDHTGFSVDAILDQASLNGGKNHAEHLINIASGRASDDFFDWDEDGRPENPGDDVGLLPYVRLFENALSRSEIDRSQALADLITQVEHHVSLMMKITASDTIAEASMHAQQLRAQQGQILQRILVLLENNQSSEFGINFEIFATSN